MQKSHFALSDEVNVDYNKVMKSAAVEGLRVEDLVKQYFEAAEKVQHARRLRRQPRVACVLHFYPCPCRRCSCLC